jgi:hypothetical protein
MITSGDILRALGASAATAGLLIACALVKMAAQDLFAPMPLGIIALIGLTVGAFGLFYERRDSERLRLARGERQLTVQELLPVQQGLMRMSQVMWKVTLAILVVGIAGIVIFGVLFQ